MSFPATLDDFTPKQDGVDDVLAEHINELQAAIEAMEAKLGVDGSSVVTSIDYRLNAIEDLLPGYELSSNKENSTLDTSSTKYPTNNLVKTYVDGMVAGLLDYRGGYNASGNVFPSSGGSGAAGAILKGDMYIISVAGVLGGVAVQIGDSLIASVDSPGQTASNWNILNSNISYVPEDVANKVTSISGASTDAQYPSAKLVYDQLALKMANPMTTAVDIIYGGASGVPTRLAKGSALQGLRINAAGDGLEWAEVSVPSINPASIPAQASGYLTGGTSPSILSVFQSLAAAGTAGNVKANIDGVVYDDIAVFPAYSMLNFVYANKNFALASGNTYYSGPFFKPDGTKVFYTKAADGTGSYMCQRTLSTPWDITTAGAETSYAGGSGEGREQSIWLSPDGTKVIVAGYYNNCRVMVWNLSTPWDITTVSSSFSNNYFGDQGGAFTFKPDGTILYINSRIGGVWRTRQYNLSTAWSVSTASDTGKYSATIFPYWYDSGTKALVANGNNFDIYNAGTAYDITTLTSSGTSITGSYAVGQIFLNSDKTRIYTGVTTCYQYNNGVLVGSMNDVASAVQAAFRARTGTTETCVYSTDKFVITSSKKGITSKILKLMTPTNGTDISGAGATPYLDCASNATETLGTGVDGLLVKLDENGDIPNVILTDEIKDAALWSIAASDTPIKNADTERSSASLTYVKLKEITINRPGTYRIYFGMKRGSSTTVYGRIYKNDVAFGTERSMNSSTYAYYSEDLTFARGDKVQLYAKTSNASAGYNVFVSSFQVRGSLSLAGIGTVNTD